MYEIEIAGQTLILMAQRAVYWPQARTLLLADAHFGKPGADHAPHLPRPQGSTTVNLARLDALVERSGAQEIVFLGGFLHEAPATLAALRRWRAHRRDLALTLVRDASDGRVRRPPAEFGLAVADQPLLRGPFALRHCPAEHPGAYVLAGELHPAWRAGPQDAASPCFWFRDAIGVLPAFGCEQGAHPVVPGAGARVFVVRAGEVVEVPA